MHGYEDDQLGEYLAVFSNAGATPASLSGYGYGQQRHRVALVQQGFGAARYIPQPLTVSGAKYVSVGVPSLQKFLQAFGAPQTGRLVLPQAGYTLAASEPTQKAYAGWQKFAKVTYPVRVAVAEDTSKLDEKKADRLIRMSSTVMVHPDVAARVAKAAAAPAPAPKAPAKPSPNVSVSTDEIQKIMVVLGVDPKNITDGKYGPTTKAKWTAATKARGLPSTSSGKSGAKTATVNRQALAAMRAAATAAAPVAATDQVITVGEAQGLLAALGFTAPGTALTDGTFGPTTVKTWAQAAAKRKLDPFMAKKSADGKQVVVRKNTYLMIKADADAKVSPRPGDQTTGLVALGPETVGLVLSNTFALVLKRLGLPPTVGAYTKWAAGKKLDGRIELEVFPPGAQTTRAPGYYVIKKTWAALDKAAAEVAPPAPPPGPQKTQLELDVARIVKESTGSVAVNTIRTAINAAIQAGRSLPKAALTGPWEPSLRDSVVMLLGISKTAMLAWQTAIPKLVSKDGKTLKLVPAGAESIKGLAARFKKAVQEDVERFKGYTKVSASELIARINNLGVTVKKFDRAGGAFELVDAIRTFIEESGGKVPAGKLVVTETKDPHSTPFVKNNVLLTLAFAEKAADERAKKTKAFRDAMVQNALKESTGFFPVRDLQQAIKHLVLSKQVSKKNEKLYGAVKVTGAFDAATRAAYTEIARTKTIGAAVQEYQALLQKQLGPRFKTALVTEARNQVWNAFLDKAVHKKNGKLSISMIPAIGFPLAGAAAQYRKETEGTAAEQEQVAEQQKVLAAAVKKSTAILSMVNVQQGLLQMSAAGRTAAQTAIRSTGVKITGLADKPTRDGLLQLSALIFPEGYDLPETMWVAYLKAVGIKVVPGAAPVRTWVASNYIALPPDLANKLAKAAGEWIAAHGPSTVKVVEFKNPSIITVVVPKKKEEVVFPGGGIPPEEQVKEQVKEKAKEVVSEPAPTDDPDKARIAREQAERDRQAREQAEREARERAAAEAAQKAELARQQAERDRLAKEQAAAAAAAAEQAAREAALRQQAAQEAGRARDAERAAAEAQRAAAVAQAQAQAAREAAAREQAGRQQAAAQETAAQAGGAQVTGPTISITTPAPQEAGMGGGMLVAGGLGLVALLALLAGDKKGQRG
jgi:hypothetical protein